MLCSNGNDALIAKIKLAMDKNEISKNGRALRPEDTEAKTKAALMETLETGKVGSLTVDPQYLVLRSHREYFSIC